MRDAVAHLGHGGNLLGVHGGGKLKQALLEDLVDIGGVDSLCHMRYTSVFFIVWFMTFLALSNCMRTEASRR